MSEKEFTDIAADLCKMAVRSAIATGITLEGAEDAAQDTMVRLWTLRSDIASVHHARGLAVVAARNKALDSLRKTKILSLQDISEVSLQNSCSADWGIEMEEDDMWLQCKLQTLPPLQYQILKMRQVECRDNKEIAAIIGIKEGSVATLLSRARRQLLNDIRKRNQ